MHTSKLDDNESINLCARQNWTITAARVIILKGCRIPPHSVVATGAIVTQVFEQENAIYGGIPAKMIKQGVDWKAERYAK